MSETLSGRIIIFIRILWVLGSSIIGTIALTIRVRRRKTDSILFTGWIKAFFKLYESAQIHTKVKTPKSKVRWIIPAVLCGMVYFGIDSYKKLSGMAEKKESADKVAAAPAAAGGGSSQDLSGAVSQQRQQLDESFKNVNGGYSLAPEMFKPTIPEMAESKPIYDGVRQVAAFEYATACIQNGKSCNCYSEQATKIREISRDLCMEYVRRRPAL